MPSLKCKDSQGNIKPVRVAAIDRSIVPAISPLSVTENGTYTAPSGVDGYSPVTVNVEGWQRPSEWLTLPNDIGTGEYIYHLYNPSHFVPSFFALKCVTTDATQWRVERGLTDAIGNFIADSYVDINNNTWYDELIPTTYTGYVWYRVSAVSSHIKNVETRRNITWEGITLAYSQSGVIERLVRLPYADYYGTVNYNNYSTEAHVRICDTKINYNVRRPAIKVELINLQLPTSTSRIELDGGYSLQDLSFDAPLWGSDVTTLYREFQNCPSLRELDLSMCDFRKITDVRQLFNACYSLKKVKFPADEKKNMPVLASTDSYTFNYISYNCEFENFLSIPISFSITGLYCATRETLLTILNALPTVTNQTLTMGDYNLAKLTDEEKAIATEKGWTLA